MLNRSLKTTKFGDNEKEVDWSNIPMTTVPKEFKERIHGEKVETRLQNMEDTSQ